MRTSQNLQEMKDFRKLMEQPCDNHEYEQKNLICMKDDLLCCHRCKDEFHAAHKEDVVGLIAYHEI